MTTRRNFLAVLVGGPAAVLAAPILPGTRGESLKPVGIKNGPFQTGWGNVPTGWQAASVVSVIPDWDGSWDTMSYEDFDTVYQKPAILALAREIRGRRTQFPPIPDWLRAGYVTDHGIRVRRGMLQINSDTMYVAWDIWVKR